MIKIWTVLICKSLKYLREKKTLRKSLGCCKQLTWSYTMYLRFFYRSFSLIAWCSMNLKNHIWFESWKTIFYFRFFKPSGVWGLNWYFYVHFATLNSNLVSYMMRELNLRDLKSVVWFWLNSKSIFSHSGKFAVHLLHPSV